MPQSVYPQSQDANVGVLRAVVVKAHDASTDDVVQTKHEISHGHLEFRCEDGILAEVAPTLLFLLGLPQPKEMTGHNLLVPV